jgi:hypothetical protein
MVTAFSDAFAPIMRALPSGAERESQPTEPKSLKRWSPQTHVGVSVSQRPALGAGEHQSSRIGVDTLQVAGKRYRQGRRQGNCSDRIALGGPEDKPTAYLCEGFLDGYAPDAFKQSAAVRSGPWSCMPRELSGGPISACSLDSWSASCMRPQQP